MKTILLDVGGTFVKGSDGRQTPAVAVNDGVDCVPMKPRKAFLVQLLNIAGTGPIFGALMGTSCSLRWRQIGERERLWVVDPSHPIVRGVPRTFALEHEEMYGEPFEIPDDGKVIFMSWFEGGDVFRSGVTFQRGSGRIFYFQPGHETFPVYYDENILKVIGNAVRWAAPKSEAFVWDCPKCEPAEPVRFHEAQA